MVIKLGPPNLDMDQAIIFSSFKKSLDPNLGVSSEKLPETKLKTMPNSTEDSNN